MESFVLSNGMNIPAIGFGCYALTPPEQKRILLDAIEAGYRHFDTASFYQTEEALGQAVRESGLPRESFFLTTKLWRTQMDDPRAAFEASLRALGTDYLDLYLIHWPRPDLERSDWKELDARVWDFLQELYQQGKVRAIGTSNFLPHHLMNLSARGGLLPMVNQLEYHPGYLQSAAVQYCRENHIQVSAWSPLGRRRLMDDPLLNEIAAAHQVTVPQVCLRFALQNGVLPLPKSSSPPSWTCSDSPCPRRRCPGLPPCLRPLGPGSTRTGSGWFSPDPPRRRPRIESQAACSFPRLLRLQSVFRIKVNFPRNRKLFP